VALIPSYNSRNNLSYYGLGQPRTLMIFVMQYYWPVLKVIHIIFQVSKSATEKSSYEGIPESLLVCSVCNRDFSAPKVVFAALIYSI